MGDPGDDSDPDTLYYPDSDDVETGTPVDVPTTVANHTKTGKVREGQEHTGGGQTRTDREGHRERQRRTQGRTGSGIVRERQGKSGKHGSIPRYYSEMRLCNYSLNTVLQGARIQ